MQETTFSEARKRAASEVTNDDLKLSEKAVQLNGIQAIFLNRLVIGKRT